MNPEAEETGASEEHHSAAAAQSAAVAAPVEEPVDASKLDLREEVVALNRVAKVVKGGRRFSFAALVVVGDGRGHVGVGFGKAKEVPDSISKAVEAGKKNLIRVPLVGRTVPFEVLGVFGAAKVMVKPAAEGTGIIAGPAARAVLELAGVRDVLTKSMGSSNQLNVVKATYEALRMMTTAEAVAARRGKTLEELLGRAGAERYLKAREEARSMKAELFQVKREERTKRGTYTAGGRDDDENEAEGGAGQAKKS